MISSNRKRTFGDDNCDGGGDGDGSGGVDVDADGNVDGDGDGDGNGNEDGDGDGDGGGDGDGEDDGALDLPPLTRGQVPETFQKNMRSGSGNPNKSSLSQPQQKMAQRIHCFVQP